MLYTIDSKGYETFFLNLVEYTYKVTTLTNRRTYVLNKCVFEQENTNIFMHLPSSFQNVSYSLLFVRNKSCGDSSSFNTLVDIWVDFNCMDVPMYY